MSAVLWRTTIWRATAIPFLALGLMGASQGDRFDLAVAPGGDSLAVRLPDTSLAVLGKRSNTFAGEQWLRAAGDGRNPVDAVSKDRCDAIGCTATLDGGRSVALVLQPAAFEEDCARATIIVTPLFAPSGCAANTILDRRWLNLYGATTLRWTGQGYATTTARTADEDRPWSPRPKTIRPPLRQRAGSARTDNPQGFDNRDEAADAPWL